MAHPKPATSEPMPLRVSSVDEMGTDESHCQSEEGRSHGEERRVYEVCGLTLWIISDLS